MKKEEARKTGIKARKNIPSSIRKDQETQIVKQMKEMMDRYEHIAFYMPIGQEVNIIAAIQYALDHHKHVYMPKVKENTLEFIEIYDLSDLLPGAFHIPEPTGHAVSLSLIELMFVPLTSFDQYGNRTGYGKGYYDSILAKIGYKVGVAFKQQMVENIETEVHDVRLDQVIYA